MRKEESINIPEIQPYGQMWYIIFVSKRFRLVRHASLILIFMLSLFHSPPAYTPGANLCIIIVFSAYCLGAVYLNMYFFVPRWLIRGKFYTYLLCVLILGAISFLFFGYADKVLDAYRLVPRDQGRSISLLVGFIDFLIFYLIFIAASSAVKLFQHWMRNLEYFYRIQSLNLQNELSLLKSQINPHFLFNTLNNTHMLIESDPARASALLVSLSDLLRYQIYDCNQDFIFLSSDIQFIHNFLSLESSRRDDFTYEIRRTGSLHDIMLPPLLFIPFIENAIKHNHDWQAPSFVWVTIHLEHNLLTFTCENSRPVVPANRNKTRGGIGLSNIKKRLALLYPGKNSLHFEERTSTFFVKLQLIL